MVEETNSYDNLEQLKSKFIIDQKRYHAESLPKLIERTMKFVRVGTDGEVLFHIKNLNNINRIKMCLVARFLASKLESKIESDITIDEVSKYTAVSMKQVSARLSTMVSERFVIRSGRGAFSVAPFFIEGFLDELDNRNTVDDKNFKTKTKRGAHKSKDDAKRTGITQRLLLLKENGFFEKPKTVSDIINTLAENGHIYPMSSLTAPLVRLVRGEKLRRIKQKSGKKIVWVYVNP